MKILASLIAPLLLAGCVLPPPQIKSPPPPPSEQIAKAHNIQSQVLQVPFESVLPQAISVLMDNNFVVRSADAKLGFVSFYQQWVEPTLASATVSEEGSILFTPAAAGATQMRVMLTGSWHDTEVGGANLYGSKGAGGQGPEEAEYRKILDMLEKGLTAH